MQFHFYFYNLATLSALQPNSFLNLFIFFQRIDSFRNYRATEEELMMQILVQGPDGGIRAVTMEAIETLKEVKLQVLRSIPNTNPNISNNYRQSVSFYFSCGGKVFGDECRLWDLNLRENSRVNLIPRVCGGGGDGGATGAESRDCYLKMYAVKKPDKVDPNETRICKWSTCALSQDTLKPPCVIDRLGNVFNKESLVRALLGKSLPPQFGHIKGLRDMIDIHLDPIPGVRVLDDVSETKFQCPIAGLEFNGKYKFFALPGCGHVISAKSLKEVQSTSCLVCHAPFSEGDKIVINGNEEEVTALRLKMEQERASKVKEKKQKKAKNGEITLKGDGADKAVQKEDENGENGGKVSAACPKRKAEENREIEVGNGKDKARAATKKFKAVDVAPVNATKEVYASIFTSSKKQNMKETYSCRALPLGRN
uniref:Ubiquitin-like domain-containing protein n=1 Tax=Araucaria cunninghamii TaxID=56994 RepID=A0A0D6R4A3_ARACU